MVRNIEGLSAWDIHWPGRREPGLSAMVRVKDEAEYLPAALRSIYAWVDEIVIAVQGEQSDGTDEIARAWADLDKVRTFHYPFDSRPNGPGHGNQPRDSVYERAYFYNWTLAQTTRTHALKWDGDMLANDELGEAIRAVLRSGGDFIRFEGAEIVDTDPLRVSRTHPVANIETRVFPADRCRFVTGSYCEVLEGQPKTDEQYTIEGPAYLHYKWAKSPESATKAWPDNWREIEHFRRLFERSKPGRLYDGPVPHA